MTNDLDWIAEAFAGRFGHPGIRAECQHVLSEVWLTLYIPDPTPAMHDLARSLEAEFSELDLTLVIQIKPA